MTTRTESSPTSTCAGARRALVAETSVFVRIACLLSMTNMYGRVFTCISEDVLYYARAQAHICCVGIGYGVRAIFATSEEVGPDPLAWAWHPEDWGSAARCSANMPQMFAVRVCARAVGAVARGMPQPMSCREGKSCYGLFPGSRPLFRLQRPLPSTSGMQES